MANRLQGKRIAILAADGVERVELETPREAVRDAGGETELVSLKAGEIQARNNDLDSAGTFTVDRLVADASVSDYDHPTICPHSAARSSRSSPRHRRAHRAAEVGVVCDIS
jgi:DJ-1/PfpI family